MFSGIVETVGRVVGIGPAGGATRIAVVSSLPATEIVLGESIALDGVCLTVVAAQGDRLGFDAVAATLSRTTLGELSAGREVNLERALRLGERVGGHLVQGHVDAVVTVLAVRRVGADCRVRLESVPEVQRYIASRGSIALGGVALTVCAIDAAGFEVALVPHTLEHTTLGMLEVGDRLNLEVDLLARYLDRILETRRSELERD